MPVGIPPPDCAETVAVKTTLWTNNDGFNEEVRVVVVFVVPVGPNPQLLALPQTGCARAESNLTEVGH
jgi:hypothetical protein